MDNKETINKTPKDNKFLKNLLIFQLIIFLILVFLVVISPLFHSHSVSYCAMAKCSKCKKKGEITTCTECKAYDGTGEVKWTGKCQFKGTIE